MLQKVNILPPLQLTENGVKKPHPNFAVLLDRTIMPNPVL